MKTCLGAILLQVSCVIAEHFENTDFANLYDTVILKCQHNEKIENPRWRHGNFTLSSGARINPKVPWFQGLQIITNHTLGEYNLKISNVSTNDYGTYWCEMQINKQISRQKVLLYQKEKKTSTSRRHVPTTFCQKVTSDGRETLSNSNINSTPFGEGTIGMSARNYINYVVFAVGFVVILCLSVACNFFVSYCRRRGRRNIKIQNRLDVHGKIEQSINNETLRPKSSDRMSNVSFRYESIDESRMITLGRERNQRFRNDIPNVDTSMASDNTYLEVVGDDQSSMSNEMNSHNLTELCEQTNGYSDSKSNSNQSVTTNDLNQSFTSDQNIFTQSEICNASACGVSLTGTKNDYVNQYIPLNRNELDQSYSTFENPKTDTISPQEKPLALSFKRYSCP